MRSVRLLDKLIAGEARFPSKAMSEMVDPLRLMEMLRETELLVADNVLQYYAEQVLKTRKFLSNRMLDAWQLNSLPCITPPFESMFVEMEVPPGYPQFNQAKINGVLLQTYSASTEYGQVALRTWGLTKLDASWVVDATFFVEDEEDVVGPIETISFALDHQGSMCVSNYYAHMGQETEESKDIIYSMATFLLLPAMFAVSLTHCKNVTLVENEPPTKLNKARVKRGKKPLLRYHTLNIESMRKVLASHGEVETKGLKHALHLCRGHFKDYRKRGLFGKNKGLYWWDSYVRGSIEEGAVIKNYQVQPPVPSSEDV